MEQELTNIRGVISENGNPKENVTVYFHDNRVEECGPSNRFSISDSNGEFYFKGKKAFAPFIAIGDPVYRWSLCIKDKELEFVVGYHFSQLGYTPESLKLNCDLKSQTKDYISGHSICEL